MRPGNLFESSRRRFTSADDPARRDAARTTATEVTIGLVAAAKLRVLGAGADPTLFHRVPERARLAAAS